MNSLFIQDDDSKAGPSSKHGGTSSTTTTSIITIDNSNNINDNEYCIDTLIINNETQPLLINFPSIIINDVDDDDDDTETLLTTTQKIKTNPNKYHKNMNLLWLISFFILYIIFGGLGFQIFELNAEVQQRDNIQLLKNEFLQKYSDIEELDLDNLLEHVMIASTNGITSLLGNSNETIAYNWNFQEAIFFSTTVITTIGYGNIAPTTDLGKIFCILYAAVGIPMTLLFLSVIVQRIMQLIKQKILSLSKRMVLFLVLVSIIVICFMIIPAFIFTYLEYTWSYLDSVYYCFVTFTTIGFGDYVPGDDINKSYRGLYKMCLTIFLIIGLILMMLAVKVFSIFPQFNLMHYFVDEEESLSSSIDQYNNNNNNDNSNTNNTSIDCYSSSEENLISQVPIRNAGHHHHDHHRGDQKIITNKGHHKTYGSIHHSYYPILPSSQAAAHPSLLVTSSDIVNVDNFYVSADPDARKLFVHDEIIIHANDSD